MMQMITLEEAVTDYFSALQKRDLEKLSSFYKVSPETMIVMLNGSLIQGYDAIVALHAEWFSDFDWSLKYKVVQMNQFDEVGMALTEIVYQDVNDTGESVEFTYYLYLLFHYDQGVWTLFYDQNTMIKKANNE